MILSLLQQDGFIVKKVTAGEYSSSCPACGGRDRFRVWPSKNRYWCRGGEEGKGCEKSGDAIQYLRDFRGLHYRDACKVLGITPKEPMKTAKSPIVQAWAPKPAAMPSEAWQERAKAFQDAAIRCLWSPDGAAMRQWLNTKRGLNDQTIKDAMLGYCPKDIFNPLEAWGFPPDVNEKGNPAAIFIPTGLTIPFLQCGKMARIKIRREPQESEDDRYRIVRGSSGNAVMVRGQGKNVCVVESELDAILLSQEVGDLCSFIALGSAKVKPDAEADHLLQQVETILISLDSDKAGYDGFSFWPSAYGRKVKRWSVISGKDPTESHLNGVDLREWISAGLPEDSSPLQGKKPEPPPTPKAPPDPVHDCGGTDGKVYMAKVNFVHNGKQIQQMDLLTLPESEADVMLKSGRVKCDRLLDQFPQGVRMV